MLINLTAGGLLGYCSSKCMTSRKVPSSNGVSAGPMITAFLWRASVEFHRPICAEVSYQVITLSATGDADTPAGGSVCIRFEGRIKLARRSSVLCMAQTNLEVAHQSASSGCRHDVGISLFDGGESVVGNSEARYCRGSWCWLNGGGGGRDMLKVVGVLVAFIS